MRLLRPAVESKPEGVAETIATTAPGSGAIVCQGLIRRFGAFIAVSGVSFSVAPGEVFGLLGANGSGKTTTIRMLTGIVAPTMGSIHVAGIDVVQDPLAIRARIGYVAQKTSLYGNLTVWENIAFFGGIYGLREREVHDRVRELGHRLQLADAENARTLVRNLSGGYKQRLALLVALLHRPTVLFLDEPTAGVDIAHRRELFDLLRDVSTNGTAILIASHHLDEMERCDRLAFLDGGVLLASGCPDELKESLEGGTRVAITPPADLHVRSLANWLSTCGFSTTMAGYDRQAAVHALVRGEAERARLDDALARIGVPKSSLSPPTLEAVFERAVGRRRNAKETTQVSYHSREPARRL